MRADLHHAGVAVPGSAAALTPEQIGLVREHLEDVLASPSFAGSKRSQDFLRLIVDHTLEGDLDSLRERMIGVALFGRPVSYDTGSDSVVRVRASEARKKLALYYSQFHEPPVVQIELPSGSYVPRFHFHPILAASQTAASAPPVFSATEAALTTEKQQATQGQKAPKDSPEQTRKMRKWIFSGAVACVALTLGLYFSWEHWKASTPAREEIRAIAVLPLENLSGTPDQDFFADGMTEELINNIGQVSTLRVTSLTSSMSYKGSRKKLPEIARELGVDAVVEGGVLKEGNKVRISAQLIDAHSDRPIWAHTYIHELANGSDWQGEVAQSIADEIRVKTTPQEQARLSRRHVVNPEAQDSYLHAILLRDANECQNAFAPFQLAIQIDPNYAEAHSAQSSCYGMVGESGRMRYMDAFVQQKAEALRAIDLDDSLSEAHAERANVAMTLDRNWALAESEFQRALQLNPSSSTSHEKYAFFLVRTGRPHEALTEIEKSVALDPISVSTFHSQGFIYYFSHQYDQALAVIKTVQGLKINFADWNFLRGDILAEKGQLPEAIASFQKAGDGIYAQGHLGNAEARMGNREEARRLAASVETRYQQTGIGSYEIALIYAGLNDRDNAFRWLEEAFRVHDVGLVYMKVDPCLDPLRSDPRFEDLLRRVGLSL